MVKVKDTKTISKNRVENSIIKAYLRNRSQNLNWIMSIIKDENLSKEELNEIFSRIGSYSATNPRFQELQNKCRELDFL